MPTAAARSSALAAVALVVGATALVITDSSAQAAITPITKRYTTASNCPPRRNGLPNADAGLLDLYLPTAGTNVPVVLMVHGGGFISGSKNDPNVSGEAADVAARGWAAASIGYCLPPDGTPGFPIEVQNIQASVRWMAQHASEYGIRSDRIALWGFSAGAALAIDAATLQGTTAPAGPVIAAAGWSGGYNFSDSRDASPLNIERSENYLGCTIEEEGCPKTAKQASAVTHVKSNTPPMYLVNSSDEFTPLVQLQDMDKALQRKNIPHTTYVRDGTEHAEDYKHDAYCPTLDFFVTYLGQYQGSCDVPYAPPP